LVSPPRYVFYPEPFSSLRMTRKQHATHSPSRIVAAILEYMAASPASFSQRRKVSSFWDRRHVALHRWHTASPMWSNSPAF
jgi:hypothetical protein